MAINKILQTFGIGATPSQSTTTWTQPSQQVTITDAQNVKYPRNIVMTNQGIRIYRQGVAAGILMQDLINALLTLEPSLTWPPLITVQPASWSVQYSTSTTLGITATSEIAITYQWQISTDNGTTWSNLTNAGVYSGVTTATLAISSVTGLNADQYRCICTNGSGSTTSSAAVLTVIPDITVQPTNSSVVHPASTTFSVTATGTATLTYQWQVSTDLGVTWSNITAAGTPSYSNWTTATLSIGTTATSMNNYKYRVVVTDGNTKTNTSNLAVLTVT